MDDLETAGYALASLTLSEEQSEHIASSLPAVSGGRGGVRNLISHPTVMRLLTHGSIGAYLWSLAGRELVAVKATLFDNAGKSNWRVQWHQDRAISVKERLDVAGFGPWSSKAGSLSVEAPSGVLSQMLALRIHLDDCGEANGPLRVIPGSHQAGKLSPEALNGIVDAEETVELCVGRGAIVAMRPLLVHSASPAKGGAHRRVLHIEFAPLEAISPLRWQSIIHLKRAA